MRLALLFSTVIFGAAMATFACSSSVTSTPIDPDAGAPNRTDQDSAAPEEEEEEEEIPSELDDAGTVSDASNTDAEPVVGDGDAGTACSGDSIRETEANDSVATADAIPTTTHTFCGRILKGGDVDFFEFTMPQSMANFEFALDTATGGNLKIEPSADGEAFNFLGTYPFKPGKQYVIKLSASNPSNQIDYRMRITFQP